MPKYYGPSLAANALGTAISGMLQGQTEGIKQSEEMARNTEAINTSSLANLSNLYQAPLQARKMQAEVSGLEGAEARAGRKEPYELGYLGAQTQAALGQEGRAERAFAPEQALRWAQLGRVQGQERREEEMHPYEMGLKRASIDKMLADTRVSDAQRNVLINEARKLDFYIGTLGPAEAAQARAGAANSIAQAGLHNEQRAWYGQKANADIAKTYAEAERERQYSEYLKGGGGKGGNTGAADARNHAANLQAAQKMLNSFLMKSGGIQGKIPGATEQERIYNTRVLSEYFYAVAAGLRPAPPELYIKGQKVTPDPGLLGTDGAPPSPPQASPSGGGGEIRTRTPTGEEVIIRPVEPRAPIPGTTGSDRPLPSRVPTSLPSEMDFGAEMRAAPSPGRQSWDAIADIDGTYFMPRGAPDPRWIDNVPYLANKMYPWE